MVVMSHGNMIVIIVLEAAAKTDLLHGQQGRFSSSSSSFSPDSSRVTLTAWF